MPRSKLKELKRSSLINILSPGRGSDGRAIGCRQAYAPSGKCFACPFSADVEELLCEQDRGWGIDRRRVGPDPGREFRMLGEWRAADHDPDVGIAGMLADGSDDGGKVILTLLGANRQAHAGIPVARHQRRNLAKDHASFRVNPPAACSNCSPRGTRTAKAAPPLALRASSEPSRRLASNVIVFSPKREPLASRNFGKTRAIARPSDSLDAPCFRPVVPECPSPQSRIPIHTERTQGAQRDPPGYVELAKTCHWLGRSLTLAVNSEVTAGAKL